MTRLLVFSDSHGDIGGLRFAIERMSGEIPPAAYLFLGDGVRDFEQLEDLMRSLSPAAQILAVRGNNDLGHPDLPDERTLAFHGVNILLVHGHRNQVKFSTRYLAMDARGKACQIALYGHTHRAKIEDKAGVWLMNPGAVGWSRSCALCLDISADGTFKPDLVSF